MPRPAVPILLLLGSCTLTIAPLRAAEADPQGVEFFEKKIRPALVEHCYACHSEAAKKIKGGLRVELREGLLRGGDSGPAVVPGQVKDSLLIQAIQHARTDLKMPPKGKLPDAVIADFVKWVEMGAPDPRDGRMVATRNLAEEGRRHWAFQPLARNTPPVVKDTSWGSTDIDRFILARLEAKGLRPVGDAPAHVLVRRLYLDLIGLPPAPQEVDRFAQAYAARPQAAVEELVDQLLARPEYGERWARHWLDVVRYADTNGFEGDGLKPNAWRYRDYVIDAFNQDKPFDRFLTEQLAGDEIEGAAAMKTILPIAAGLLLAFSLAVQAQPLLPPDRPIGEVIDHYVDAKLKEAKVKPAAPAADTTVIRRLYLDLIGRIPTAVEARQLASQPLDRTKLIESLVSSPAFARHNANEFDVLLRNRNMEATSLQPYLLNAFQENRPWDVMFRDLLGAPDPSKPELPTKAKAEEFVGKRLKDADALTRDVSSVFFGLNITCAQCHRHPEIKGLTQDYFFGMKAFFGYSYDFQGKLLERQYVKVADFKAKSGETRRISMMFLSGTKVEMDNLPEQELVAAIAEETKLIQEKTKEYAKSKELPPAPKQSARKRLAEIALDETNREMFARSIVNRLWFRFYGYGLVMRVDQMHAKNEPSHPELLNWLARDLIAHKYDLKRLITGLVSSRAYARSSEWKGTPPAMELFAVAPTRPLTPAQWGMSYHIANQPDIFKPDDPIEVRQKKLADVEKLAGIVAFIEQPFDDFQVGIDEPLKLSNDEGILKAVGSKLIPVLRKLPDPRQQIDEATWMVLSRPATPEEHKLFDAYLAQRKDRPDEGLRQVLWALVNSPEFRFNH